jgi:hypothetical protein
VEGDYASPLMSGEKSGSLRSLESRFNHTMKIAEFRMKQYLDNVDKIYLPFTLEELTNAKNDSTIKKKLQEICNHLRQSNVPSRPFSVQYLDKNGEPIFYYLGERIEGKRPKEIHLWEDENGNNNFHRQFKKRTMVDLLKARNRGKKILHDGIAVRLSLSLLFSLKFYIKSSIYRTIC